MKCRTLSGIKFEFLMSLTLPEELLISALSLPAYRFFKASPSLGRLQSSRFLIGLDAEELNLS